VNKHEALRQKEVEIQQQLDGLVRNSGFFSVGDVIKFSLKLEQVPVAVRAEIGGLKPFKPHQTTFYKYLSVDLTESDWKKLYAAGLKDSFREMVLLFQSQNNKPVGLEELRESYGTTYFSKYQFDSALRKRGVNIRVVCTGVAQNKKGERDIWYQLCIVEPKSAVKL